MALEKFIKQPADELDYDISFTDWLASMGDTALSHTATADTGITLQSSEMSVGGVVKVWMAGGVTGQAYKVTVTMTTAGGRIKQAEIIIKVKET